MIFRQWKEEYVKVV